MVFKTLLDTLQKIQPKVSKGFSTLECMLFLIILGIFIAIGIPSFQHYRTEQSLKNNTENLKNLAILSQKIALTSEHPVILCPTEDYQSCSSKPTTSKILAFIDKNHDRKLSSPDSLIGSLDVSHNKLLISYQGFPYSDMQVFSTHYRINSNGTFKIFSPPNHEAYFISINKAGETRITQS
jgi:type IV fimbrial biogenesis protein FimT